MLLWLFQSERQDLAIRSVAVAVSDDETNSDRAVVDMFPHCHSEKHRSPMSPAVGEYERNVLVTPNCL